jgi:hypothetical protein
MLQPTEQHFGLLSLHTHLVRGLFLMLQPAEQQFGLRKGSSGLRRARFFNKRHKRSWRRDEPLGDV